MNACAAARRPLRIWSWYAGYAIAARIATTVRETISSMSVKPPRLALGLLRWITLYSRVTSTPFSVALSTMREMRTGPRRRGEGRLLASGGCGGHANRCEHVPVGAL